MRKISSLVIILAIFILSLALFINHSTRSYSKASFKQSIENVIKPLDNPQPPQKNQTGPKPIPKQPPKDQQKPPPSGHKGEGPSVPDPTDPPPKQPDPCNCPHKAEGSRS